MVMASHRWAVLFAVIGLAFLAGCASDKDAPLVGDRTTVVKLDATITPDAFLEGAPMRLPPPKENTYWPRSDGMHPVMHLALHDGAKTLTKQSIRGNNFASYPHIPLFATPVIAKEAMFVLDGDGAITAFRLDDLKHPQWTHSLLSARTRPNEYAFRGGLLFAGALFATTGTEDVVAIHPQDGHEIWRQLLRGPTRCVPLYADDRLFVSTWDDRVYALDAHTGAILWTKQREAPELGMFGQASPVITDQGMLIVSYGSGIVVGLDPKTGTERWQTNISYANTAFSHTVFQDIDITPVVSDDMVFVSNNMGRLVALRHDTGEPLWEQELGSSVHLWPTEDVLFALTRDNVLLAIQRQQGGIRWVTRLPEYPSKKASGPRLLTSGPLLADGKLFVVRADGILSAFSPETGEELQSWDIPREVSLPPIVAQGSLHLLSRDGTLVTLR